MLSVLLRREGYQVEFLGADLLVDDLVTYAEDVEPDMIILSAGFEHTASPLYKMQASLKTKSPPNPRWGSEGAISMKTSKQEMNWMGSSWGRI